MVKATPSRKKFNKARQISRELHSQFGGDLKTVFVHGSVASNMAHPGSDLDIILILQDNALRNLSVAGTLRKIHEVNSKYGRELSIRCIGQSIFESLGDVPFSHLGDIFQSLKTGVIPVFGKDYANAHRDCWEMPTLSFIRRKYPNQKPLTDSASSEIELRTKSKRSLAGRKRFMP